MILPHPHRRTFMNRLLILPVLAVLHLPAACDGARRTTDPAKTIHARAGKPFRITLRSGSAMGQRWLRVDSAAAGSLVLVDSGSIPPRRITIGGSGHLYWTFRSSRPGEATVSMMRVLFSDTTRGTDTTRFRVVIR
ncbi:MAG TPA: protease inhibitor I42 family protein [Longimicrobium sp.]|uniref:protease inhibitor I42 family protein n=1 Tax=Longimicrobium sp. TaxID=2029185 RepID=UPI002ED961BA